MTGAGRCWTQLIPGSFSRSSTATPIPPVARGGRLGSTARARTGPAAGPGRRACAQSGRWTSRWRLGAKPILPTMPIHEKLRGRDLQTTRNYLRVSLCNIHDELVERMDPGGAWHGHLRRSGVRGMICRLIARPSGSGGAMDRTVAVASATPLIVARRGCDRHRDDGALIRASARVDRARRGAARRPEKSVACDSFRQPACGRAISRFRAETHARSTASTTRMVAGLPPTFGDAWPRFSAFLRPGRGDRAHGRLRSRHAEA